MVPVILALVSAARPCPGAEAGARLTRDETVALFARLAEAASTASTFQAKFVRTEESGFVLDAEPLVSEGRITVKRPDCYRQEIAKPRKSLTIISGTDLWIYFEEVREAQHVDLTKGVKGRSETTLQAFMAWIEFDLPELEKKYRVEVRKAEPVKGVTIIKAAAAGAAQGAEGPPARSPERSFRIDFTPREAHLAPGLAHLALWVDGENPWPLKIERETADGDLVKSDFPEMLLEAPLEPGVFEFRPPRGTKVVELSE
jgi:outer membrane lipoprotein-sorting protein